MALKNANYFRNLQPGFDPSEFGLRLAETLQQLDDDRQTLAQQTNSNTDGRPQAPPAIGALNVTGQNGKFNIRITDRGPIYAGINYFAVHADNPHFTNAETIDLGQSRNHTVSLGNVTRYWAAYSSYATSLPSPPAYHGGAIPRPVTGGGIEGGPPFQPSEGTGTSGPGVAFEGPGIAPFRSTTGAPPKR
jgi:hypothetical protein